MTEKNYNPQQKEQKAMKKQKAFNAVKKVDQPVESPKKVEKKQHEIAEVNTNTNSDLHKEKSTETIKTEEEKAEIVKEEKKEIKKEVPKVKKTEVSVKGINLPISTKDAKFVCKFVVKKRIGDAIRDLEKVEVGKKAVPMKGEIPHRKGKGISSGRFPKKASKNFIILLKSLAANANEGNLDEPIIVEAIANMAARPRGRFGRTQKKRTHVKIIAKDKTQLKNKKKMKKEKNK